MVAVKVHDYAIGMASTHLYEPGKILRVFTAQLLAVIHAELRFQYRVDAQCARAEDGFRLRRAQDGVQARVSESPCTAVNIVPPHFDILHRLC